MSEGLGFNLCVVLFLNVCVPNFELEDGSWRGSEVWHNGQTGGD